jgi:hypothetical protein
MTTPSAPGIVAEGRAQYLRLLDEATALLRELDSLGASGLAEALQRRQQIVDGLQRYDGPELPADFLAFREETTAKILEIDRLVIALAREQQESIRERLSSKKRSKSASRVYDTGTGGAGPRWLSDTV